MSSSEPAPERPSSPSESAPAPITFTVKSSSDTKYTVSLPPTTPISDLKSHLATLSEIPADRQRLIYSGRVMKDEETLSTYKVQNGHTVHMVKGAASNAARSAAAGGSATAPTTAVPTNIAAGSGNNPLAGLTGARYAGHVQLPSADIFGPDGGMGAPPSPESLIQAMSNPSFQATMNEMLQNPQFLDYIISSNPMLQQMSPEARQLMHSSMFREMMTNPEIIRQMSQMSAAMGGARGLFGAMGAGAGANSFPEPGRTDTTPATEGHGANTASGSNQNPGAGAGAPGAIPGFDPAANPFAALFGNPAAAGTPQAAQPPFSPGLINWMLSNAARPSAAPSTTNPTTSQQPTPPPQQPPPNPLQPQHNPLLNPALAAALLGNPGASGVGENPFAAMFGGLGAAPTPPLDNRPPEERYAEQLRTLNDMGFFDFERNVEALRRSGGSVQGAINHLLGG